MSQYFDKDFFKFLLGFAAIIIISLIVVATLKEYQTKQNAPVSPSVNIATTKP